MIAPVHPTKERKSVAIVGGGIAGLTAALRMQEAGYEVHIYEKRDRVGGKIRSKQSGEQVTDLGAEFIDSDRHELIGLAKELGIKLVPAGGNSGVRFRLASGKMIDEQTFNEAFKPIAQRIEQDKQAITHDPMGERAQVLDQMSMSQYLHELNKDLGGRRSLLSRLSGKNNGVSEEIIDAAEKFYASEAGRPASDISALQYVHESGGTKGFLRSDAALQVEGGTQRLTEALKAKLEETGAEFHMGKELSEIGKAKHDKFSLGFADGEELRTFDHVVMATQAHHLTHVKGMNKFIPSDDLEALGDVQHTHNAKIAVKMKTPPIDDELYVSSLGFQAWSREPGETVFLVGGELAQKYKGKKLVDVVLEDYAKAHNTTVEKLFDDKPESITYVGPDPTDPCYPSPASGQAIRLKQIARNMDEATVRQGIGFVGNYIPDTQDGSIGFMANGVNSAERATSNLMNIELARQQAREMHDREAGEKIVRVLETFDPVGIGFAGDDETLPPPPGSKKGHHL
ncbi:MAG: flavin monoamine oxidase family protein [Rickettsiales bacterium]